MIAALACALLSQQVALIRIDDPDASTVVLQAVIRLVEPPPDLAVAEVLCEVLAEETEQYSRAQVRAFCGQTGHPPTANLMPDHIRVDMEFPKGQLDVAVLMMASALRAPSFPDSAVTEAAKRLESRSGSVWSRTLAQRPASFAHVSRASVVAMHRRLFRPELTTIAVRGSLGTADLEEAWGNRSEGWASSGGAWTFAIGAPTVRPTPEAGFAVVELAGPEFFPNDAALAIKLLAVYALGVGKGSAVFRVLREREGWSYRQEAFFWPTPKGFRTRLLMATDLPDDDWPKALRAALRADLEAWTDAALKRASGLARARLERGIGPNPFYLTPNGPAGETPAGQAFEAAYWHGKAGRALDESRLARQFELVRLDELKETALDMLDRAIGRVTR